MAAGDNAAVRECHRRIIAAARGRSPAELTAAIENLAPVLGMACGVYSKAAVLAGALVEWGGSPLPLRDVLPERAAIAMELCDVFRIAWAKASGGAPLPGRRDFSAMSEVTDRIVASAPRGISADIATQVAVSWYEVDDWLKAMITVMASREFRAAMGHRDRVRDAAGAIASQLEAADCVLGLAVVLDDEPLVVLDHTSGRGFRLTMSGVGDNFQLHTLLADRLTGNSRPGLLSLEPPPHAWVTAATNGPVRPPDGDPIFRRFRLFDGHGAYVYPEGRPADIAPLDDTRVLVLYPPLGPFGWTGGRFYQHMTPTLTLDHVMDSATATSWLARIAPADQSDLMASNG
jgi:hypothetical protein